MLAKLDPTHPPGHSEPIINSFVGLVYFPGPPEGSVPLFSRETLRMFVQQLVESDGCLPLSTLRTVGLSEHIADNSCSRQ